MATVKSLEERIDDMADDLSAVKTQLAVVVSNQGTVQGQLAALTNAQTTTQTQLAVVIAKLDSTIDALKATSTRPDATVERLDRLIADHGAEKTRTDTTFGVLRWAGATSFALLVTIVFGAFSIARSAGSLETRVQDQQKTLDDVRRDVAEIRAKQK
jgi:phage shock protein A